MSTVWLVLNINSVLTLDLGNGADTTKTMLDVVLNGPQLAQVVQELINLVLAIGGMTMGFKR